jgi:hypothetical protein
MLDMLCQVGCPGVEPSTTQSEIDQSVIDTLPLARGGSRGALDHPNFFQQTCELQQKKFARNILCTLFTLISDLKIIQQAVKLPPASRNDSI